MRWKFLAVLLAVLCRFGTAQLLDESFTGSLFPPSGWATYDRDSGLEPWSRLESLYSTPPACAGCRHEAGRQSSDWLCSPALYPQGADTMFRWQFRSESAANRESISVWVSTTTQDPDSFQFFVAGFGVGSEFYAAESVSLGGYAGQRVYVALEYCSDSERLGAYVDDVSGPPLHFSDVGATGIAIPPDSGSPDAFYPRVAVSNFADTTVAGFAVHMVIRDSGTDAEVYRDSAFAGSVAPGETVNVDFVEAWAAVYGTYRVESWSALAGDLHPENDTSAKWTRIYLDPPTVTVTAPDGGEVWQVGSSHDINWTHGAGPAAGDSIWYRTSDAAPWLFIAAVGPGVTNYAWDPIPDTPSESCRVRVLTFNVAGTNEDSSDACFTIVYQDVGATAILSPAGTCDSGTLVVPRTEVRNFGSRTETFPVTFRISGVYDRTVTGVTLAAGQTDTIDFPDWTAEPEGRYATLAFTDLTGDENRTNDTASGAESVFVIPPERHDVGATAILAPTDTIDSGAALTPRAVVFNYGTRDETFPVTLNIGSVYSRTLVGVFLAPGQTDTLDFPDWTAEPLGTHQTVAFTNLTGDESRANDTTRSSVTVQLPPRHDVGATAILTPGGTYDSGTVVTPRAVVYNFQTRTEVFPVTFRIGSVYDRTVSGVTLTPGQTDTVDFPDWVAEPEGRYATLAFTDLTGDENRANDTAFGAESVFVIPPERHDVGATAILAPLDTLDSGTVVTPRVVVRNFQTRTEVFPVTFRIGSTYDQTLTGITLTPGQTDTIDFISWVAEPIGVHQTVAFTDLTGDQNRANDTVRNSVAVQVPARHDVGATAILAPLDTLDSGTVVTPRAVVYNFQTRTETFPVTFRIGSVYSQTVPGVTLAPGQTDTVGFPDWVAQPVGTHATVAFTDLTGDQNRANDTVRNSVTVRYPPRFDVGATSILAPRGTVDSGMVVAPQAVVRNFGTRNAVFPVTLSIGGSYSQTVTGVTLIPGQIDTIGFPDWTAEPVDTLATMAFTDLSGDENRANDTVRSSVVVQPPPRHDVATTEIVAPLGTIDSGTVVTPKAVVSNLGTRNETFPVTFNIGSVYSRTVTGVSLRPGEIDTIVFPNWTAEPLGVLQTAAFTNLSGDENRANDTVLSSVTVQQPPRFDVGATAILAPLDTVDSGVVILPRAVVRNFGTRDATFPVTFSIGSGYTQTVTGVTLTPGQTDTVNFPFWTAEPVGQLPTAAFTDLAGDENRANDTVHSSVTVRAPPRHDVGATAIVAPVDTVDSGTAIEPRAVVCNFGAFSETFRVTFSIAPGYSRTVTGVSLLPGQSDTIIFPGWSAGPVGQLATMASTDLAGDQDPSNDTVRGTVVVRQAEFHDVGATAIFAPNGTLDSGTLVVPRAAVFNYGEHDEVFPVAFRIGQVYDQTVSNVTLAPGQTDTIDFPDWVAQPVGDYTTLSFTALAGDRNRSNDTVYGADTLHVVYPARHDVGATAILAPLDAVDSGSTVTPLTVVHNFGTRNHVFPVTFRIGGVYDETMNGVNLAPGQTDTVRFPTWSAEPVGEYSLVSFTDLTGDQNRANDTVYGQDTLSGPETLRVRLPARHDVGATAILSPAGTHDSGTVIAPRAVVYNFQTRTEVFPVTFRIGSVYEQTVADITLDPGQTDTVDFPDWVAEPEGRHATLAFTDLVGDQNQTNDTAFGAESVFVGPSPRHDVGAVAILSPAGALDSGTVTTPRAAVYNYGNSHEDFPVTLTIGTIYSQTAQASLAPGQTDTVTFQDWPARPPGRYAVVCFTDLPHDRDRANDTATAAVDVILASDVGVIRILAPAEEVELALGLVRKKVQPQAHLANFGLRTEAGFGVRFFIEEVAIRPGDDTTLVRTVYEESTTVIGPLDPGATVDVTFPEATLGFGRYVSRCTTLLAGDRQAENDASSLPCRVFSRSASDRDGDFEAIIYTRAGERVARATRSIRSGDALLAEWDGRNERGNRVAPGVYICVLHFRATDGDAQTQQRKMLVTDNVANFVLTWRRP